MLDNLKKKKKTNPPPTKQPRTIKSYQTPNPPVPNGVRRTKKKDHHTQPCMVPSPRKSNRQQEYIVWGSPKRNTKPAAEAKKRNISKAPLLDLFLLHTHPSSTDSLPGHDPVPPTRMERVMSFAREIKVCEGSVSRICLRGQHFTRRVTSLSMKDLGEVKTNQRKRNTQDKRQKTNPALPQSKKRNDTRFGETIPR